jgi:hypothetical protein
MKVPKNARNAQVVLCPVCGIPKITIWDLPASKYKFRFFVDHGECVCSEKETPPVKE